MQRNLLTLAVIGLLGPFAQAATLSSQPATFVVTPQANAITVSFSGLTLSGFSFAQVSPTLADFGIGPVTGTLTSVSVNATLDASEFYTYANDLTVYVDSLPLSTGGLLQVGGYNSLSALERKGWANGDSSAPGTTVIDTVTLTTPLTFTGTASDPAIWLGNGYADPDAVGTWTGSITLNFTSAVPEPASWALMLAGGAGLAAWAARRRRTLDGGR